MRVILMLTMIGVCGVVLSADAKPHNAAAISAASIASATNDAYQSCVEAPPSGVTGGFQLSHSYPTTKPAPAGPFPWEAFDFMTQPEQYARAVLQYARHDLDPVHWDASQVPMRWFHAPWMAFGPETGSGRECFHGLTKERTVHQSELLSGGSATKAFGDYAVGYYNDVGAWTFAQVFGADPSHPDASKARFDNGAVSVKLLFTTATAADVPSIGNSLSWQCDIFDAASQHRRPQQVELLQVDIAVRDQRNDARTGWVFGTFEYNANAIGTDPLDRLEVVGLMWGNDSAALASGGPLTETWINPAIGTYQHLGRKGRLNGPVDNPISSCLSCHSTAQTPRPKAGMTPPPTATDPQAAAWFRNIPAGQPFEAGGTSLDYSLQLAVAFVNAATWLQAHPAGMPMLRMKAVHQFVR